MSFISPATYPSFLTHHPHPPFSFPLNRTPPPHPQLHDPPRQRQRRRPVPPLRRRRIRRPLSRQLGDLGDIIQGSTRERSMARIRRRDPSVRRTRRQMSTG